MEKILDFLKELNLTEVEAKLYLTLLEAGPSSVRDIAQKIGLKRTTAYLYIENLMKKGLITKNVINSRSQISPIQPTDGLKALVKETVENTNDIEKKLPETIENIHSSFPGFKEVEKFEIKQYNHISGVKQIYEEAFKAEDVRSYVKIVEGEGIFNNNVEVFNEAFKKNPKLVIKEILYDTPLSKEQAPSLLAKTNRYAYKFMPKDMKLTSEDMLIYDGKVAIINYRENIHSVVLQSKDLYNNFKELFDFIWKMIPDA